MRRLFYFFSIFFLLLVFSKGAFSDVFFDERVSVEEAYVEARLLRSQYRNKEARKYLKYSAENGSVEGAYLYAIELGGFNSTVRTHDQALELVVSSAESSYLPAIKYIYFNPVFVDGVDLKYWRSKYLEAISSIDNEAEMSFNYFLINQSSDIELAKMHLNKSSELGYPAALLVQGDLIKKGNGYYFFDSSRVKDTLSFYQKAAESNYLPAIKKYIAELLLSENDVAFEWAIKAAKMGDLASVAIVARALAGNSRSYKKVDVNLPEAKAYYDVYLSVTGRDRFTFLYDLMVKESYELEQSLNDEQKQSAEEFRLGLNLEDTQLYDSNLYWFDDNYPYVGDLSSFIE